MPISSLVGSRITQSVTEAQRNWAIENVLRNNKNIQERHLGVQIEAARYPALGSSGRLPLEMIIEPVLCPHLRETIRESFPVRIYIRQRNAKERGLLTVGIDSSR